MGEIFFFSVEDSSRKKMSSKPKLKPKVSVEKNQECSGQLFQQSNHHSLPTKGTLSYKGPGHTPGYLKSSGKSHTLRPT